MICVRNVGWEACRLGGHNKYCSFAMMRVVQLQQFDFAIVKISLTGMKSSKGVLKMVKLYQLTLSEHSSKKARLESMSETNERSSMKRMNI